MERGLFSWQWRSLSRLWTLKDDREPPTSPEEHGDQFPSFGSKTIEFVFKLVVAASPRESLVFPQL